MRILAIRGKNLASLRGEFELRLDQPPISSSNLFSISGPTGSGKSTLLDALCLALYGRTPRLSDDGGHAIGAPGEDEKLRLKSNDARALLSRGTADGFAEVDFQPGQWPKEAAPMRTLVLKIERRQADMFAEQGGIKYLGIVSNDFTLDGTALIRWHYRKAGCIEVVHDVVKNELGAGVLPCAAFGANAAWFRLSLLTYNLLSAMKVLALPPPFEDARPKRLRFAVFNLPARLVSHARKLLARVAQGLLERADMLLGRARLRATYAT